MYMCPATRPCAGLTLATVTVLLVLPGRSMPSTQEAWALRKWPDSTLYGDDVLADELVPRRCCAGPRSSGGRWTASDAASIPHELHQTLCRGVRQRRRHWRASDVTPEGPCLTDHDNGVSRAVTDVVMSSCWCWGERVGRGAARTSLSACETPTVALTHVGHRVSQAWVSPRAHAHPFVSACMPWPRRRRGCYRPTRSTCT